MDCKRLTLKAIDQILIQNEGFRKMVPLYGCDVSWYYVIENGILKIYEIGKGKWSDSRFNTFADRMPIIASVEQTRRFIRKYLL